MLAASMIEPVVERVEVACGVEPARLWPLVSDTNRLNQESGLGDVEVRPNPEGGLPRYLVSTKFGPMTLQWAEYPFEWTAPERLSVRREVTQGVLERIVFTLTLEPTPEGCEVGLELALTPRHRRAHPLASVAAKVVIKKLAEGVRRLAASLESESVAVMQAGLHARALDAAMARLSEQAPAHVQALAPRLRQRVQEAPDYEVARIRPYELAEQWQTPRRATLELCLHASVAGVLDLSWDVICPSCRTATQRLPQLSALEGTGHCDLCDVGFGVQMDQAVEATFTVSAAVRAVGNLEFCTGGPGATPHVVAQTHLEPEGGACLSVPAEAGRYRLFVRGGATATVEVGEGHPSQVQLEVGEAVSPAHVAVAPGGDLQLILRSGPARHVKIEHLEWSSRAATAYEVTTVAAFRRLFSREALKPGLGLQIRRAALMFSDLSASTALYAREGDAAAFRLVQDHFDLMQACIERHSGVVVKTIGDAVMASFVDERSALQAALEAQQAFETFRAEQPASEGVYLKIGVYAGACYAVSANGTLDFFGQTVNVAARLQGQAGDGETVATAVLWRACHQDPWAAPVRATAPFVPRLKGVDEGLEVVRLRCAPS